MADTAGSAAYVAKQKDKSKSDIASLHSADIYGLEVIMYLIHISEHTIQAEM